MGAALPMLALVGIGGQLAGGLMQTRAVLEQGEAEYEAAEYNRMALLQRGSAEAERRFRLGRRKIGYQAARIGKSGVAMEGSVLDPGTERSRVRGRCPECDVGSAAGC